MNEGDVALAPLPQADGATKNRPVVVLRKMPPFGDLLVCGVSTQIRQAVPGFDETIEPTHADFSASGLKAASLIRLGFLAVLPQSHFAGAIGAVSKERHQRLLTRLSDHLRP
jgi:mRNA interferase MazF